MKKKIFSAITAALILTSMTACKENVSENRPDAQGSSAADNSAPVSSEDPSSAENENSSDNSGADSEPAKKDRAVYGETEIPDISSGETDLQPLESMVFEVYKFGDYSISLIGEDVKTNKNLCPGEIIMSALRIEVEKDGVALGDAGYIDEFSWGAQYPVLTLFEDKLGSYISLYDMEVPVIAMKYYFPESAPTDVEKAMMFATIQNGAVDNGFVGSACDPIGVGLTSKVVDGKQIYLTSGSENKSDETNRYRAFIFGSEEFEVVDGQTLVDKDAGIRYKFDLSDPTLFERYTAEKID